MTARKPQQGIDPGLEADLREIRTGLSGPDSPEPPDLLDKAILNAARRELEESGKQGSRGFSLRWLGAFATASVVVLALGIVVQQQQESTGFREEFPITEPAQSTEQKIPSGADSTGLRARAQPQSDMPAAEVAAPAQAQAEAVPGAQRRSEAVAGQALTDEFSLLEESDATIPAAEDWIARLLQLKEAAQLDLLDQELAAFRAAYPEYPLPPELLD